VKIKSLNEEIQLRQTDYLNLKEELTTKDDIIISNDNEIEKLKKIILMVHQKLSN